jgi:tartrate dehydrogenase/decarboxylase/D-malate dehydrogenase
MALSEKEKARRKLSMSKKQYRIAVIPGDGIGKEVVPEGLRVLETAAKKHGISVHFDHFDFASWDYTKSTAR